MQIDNYQQAVDYLLHELPRTSGEIFRGGAGLARAKHFFEELRNPQDKLRVIHIAGTSGKGTTAMLLSRMLATHGLSVGTALSPHVYDIRERCQINSQLISQELFTEYLNKVLPSVQKLVADSEPPSYYEVLLAIALVAFVDQKVDYAVLETGLGGLLDATNTMTRPDKLCLLTSVGFDHAEILGDSLHKIATQKAGIIQDGNHVIALKQRSAVEQVVTAAAQHHQAELEWVGSEALEAWLPDQKLSQLNDQLWGDHQTQNAALAAAALRYLAKRDGWPPDPAKLTAAITQVDLPGRFEQIAAAKKIWVLDGAHNQQKLDAAAAALKQKFNNQAFGILLAMRESKAIPKLPAAEVVITTSFQVDYQDMPIQAFESADLASQLPLVNPDLSITAAINTQQALQQIINSHIDLWLVTGSFFMLSEVKSLLGKLKL